MRITKLWNFLMLKYLWRFWTFKIAWCGIFLRIILNLKHISYKFKYTVHWIETICWVKTSKLTFSVAITKVYLFNLKQKWLFRMIMAIEGQFSELLLVQLYLVISNPIVSLLIRPLNCFVWRYFWKFNRFLNRIIVFFIFFKHYLKLYRI